MLTCRACLWRSLPPADRPIAHALRGRLAQNVKPLHSARFLRTSAAAAAPAPTRDATPARSQDRSQIDALENSEREPWKNSRMAANQKRDARRVQYQSNRDRDRERERDDKEADEELDMRIGRRSASKLSSSDWDRRRAELRHLRDPMELAEFVKKQLARDKPAEMVQLVQMASHSMNCIVSWNHIIDHYLATEKVKHALKVYNDMKKRGQFPDSYTYTILLRGLSINAQTSGVVEKALSIYHSLSAPNSRVEPSIIHTNAALRVCARAMDLDAMWGVAAKIPESGPGSANAITYITILNAIRQSALVNRPSGETPEEAAARIDHSVVEARRMWEIIIARWRKADLIIDEELVCAMGRLLLVGARPRDWDDVLSLVEQTMNIPRLVPRLGTPEREAAGYPRLRAPDVPEQFRVDDDHLAPGNSPMRGDEFLPVATKSGSAPTYVTPGNNTLSVIQEACQKVVGPKAAQQYWDLLSSPASHAITPDLNNLHQHLRNLRLNRSSTAATQLVENDIIGKGLKPRPGTFRIAMSTCSRDKNNAHAVPNAMRLMRLMIDSLVDMDAKTITMFAELAIRAPNASGAQLVDALTLLHPVVRNLRIQISVGAERFTGVGTWQLDRAKRDEALAAIRAVYGVYDRLCLGKLIAEEAKKPFLVQRARLAAFIGKERGRTDKVSYGSNSASGDHVDAELPDEAGIEAAAEAEVAEEPDVVLDHQEINTTKRKSNRREVSPWMQRGSRKPAQKKGEWKEKRGGGWRV